MYIVVHLAFVIIFDVMFVILVAVVVVVVAAVILVVGVFSAALCHHCGNAGVGDGAAGGL